MSKAEDKSKQYREFREQCGIKDPVMLDEIEEACFEGYHQAEKDLLENKHKKSWRLDEKLWKGIKDIEEASYQYVYDASNDWAYDVPTWDDVQEAFKAGSEWKENVELTLEDVYDIWRLYNKVCSEGQIFGHDETSEEVLKRFKEYKINKQ